jgi:hypothetical protein
MTQKLPSTVDLPIATLPQSVLLHRTLAPTHLKQKALLYRFQVHCSRFPSAQGRDEVENYDGARN